MPRLSNADMRRRMSREARRSANFDADDIEQGLEMARESGHRWARRVANRARTYIQVKTWNRTDEDN